MWERLRMEPTEQRMHRLSDWLLWNKLFEPMQISKLWKRLPTRMLSLWEGDVQFGVWLPNNWYNNEHRGKSIQGWPAWYDKTGPHHHWNSDVIRVLSSFDFLRHCYNSEQKAVCPQIEKARTLYRVCYRGSSWKRYFTKKPNIHT